MKQNSCWVCGHFSRFAGVDHCHAGEIAVVINQEDGHGCDEFVPLGELDIDGAE